jgi:hypothetical protein
MMGCCRCFCFVFVVVVVVVVFVVVVDDDDDDDDALRLPLTTTEHADGECEDSECNASVDHIGYHRSPDWEPEAHIAKGSEGETIVTMRKRLV